MNDQLLVLNALLRLARRRVPATLHEIDARVGLAAARVRTALAALARGGLVARHATGPALAQLTLEGFALSVALAKRTAGRARKRSSPRPAQHAA